jgi:endoglucanase
VKWGTDSLLKAQGTDAAGTTIIFLAQVGDVAAGSAAALASASVLFRQRGSLISRNSSRAWALNRG